MKSRLRRVLIVLLDPHPKWWASVWLWVIIAAACFAASVAVRTEGRSVIGYKWSVSQDAAGAVSWGEGAPEQVQSWLVTGGYRLKYGLGYRRFESVVPVVRSRTSPASVASPETERKLVGFIASDFPRLFDHELSDEEKLWLYALKLWIAGQTIEVRRAWWNGPLVLARWPGMALFLVAPGVWYLRATQAAWYRQQLARSEKGLCPNCAYDLTGASGTKCPECGANPLAMKTEAAKALRIS